MDDSDRDRRMVTDAHGPSASSALTVTHALRLLLAASWPERWEMLAADSRLVHAGVVRACAEQDGLLALVLGRVAEVGVEQTRAEFPLAAELAAVLVSEEDDAVSAGVTAFDAAVSAGLWWLAPLLEAAVEPLARRVSEEDAERLKRAALWLFVVVHGAQGELIPEAFRLATADWRQVWEELSRVTDLAAMAVAAEVVARHAGLFGQADLAGWADELQKLLLAAAERGAEAAVQEHQMVLTVWAALAEPLASAEDQARRCGDLAAELGRHFQATGASGVSMKHVYVCG